MQTPANAHAQSGYVLFVMLALLLSLSTFAAVRLLKQNTEPSKFTRQGNLAALEIARTELILDAIARDSNPGVLPCPDSDNKGITPSCTAADALTAARYPYKVHPFTDTPPAKSDPERVPIKDADGECIWYALAPSFRNALDPASRKTTNPDIQPINPDTVTGLMLNGTDVIAVLISPGMPMLSQSRCKAGSDGCPAANQCSSGVAADFLEKFDNADNVGNTGVFASSAAPTALNTTTGKCIAKTAISNTYEIGPECINDVILPVTRNDMMKPLIREVLRRLTTSTPTDALPSLQARLATTKTTTTLNVIRDPDPFGFDDDLFGALKTDPDPKGIAAPTPHAESNGCYRSAENIYDSRPLWLCSNDWYRFINYDPTSTSLSISFKTSPASTYRCSVSLNNTNEIKCQ